MMAGPREDRHSHWDLPEAVDTHNPDNLPEVVPTSYLEAANPTWEQEKCVHHGDQDPARFAPSYNGTSPAESGHANVKITGNHNGPEKRILGLRPKTFCIVAATAAFVVLAIIVGIAVPLSLANKNNSSGESSSSSTTTPTPDDNTNNTTSNILQGSSLAATNYTDASGNLHSYVFFQSSTNRELAVSTWDSQNQTWETLSITKMLSASSGISLDIISGSPIAAYTYTNPTFQTRVYFLTTGNLIRELVTSEDPSLKTSWRQGRLGGDKLVTAAEGTKLAALRPHCGTSRDCQVNFPWMAVAYQGEGGVVAVSRADVWKPMEIQMGPARGGTPVGLASVMRNGNITDVGWSLVYEEDGQLQEFNSEALVTEWSRGPTIGPAPTLTASAPSTNLAFFSYDLVTLMLITISADGSLVQRTKDSVSKAWGSSQTPNLIPASSSGGISAADTSSKQSPENPKFLGIAGSPARKVYGIVNDGRIHEWEFFSPSPRQWSYVGEVPTKLES